MLKLLYLFFFYSFLFTQNYTIKINQFYNDSILWKFESQLISDIINIAEAKSGHTFIVKKDTIYLFSSLFNKVSDGNTVSIGSISITEERKKKYTFSRSYLPIRYSVFVKRSSVLTKETWKKSNHTMGYLVGSTDEKEFASLSKKYGFKGIAYGSDESKLIALNSGEVDFIIFENISFHMNKEIKLIETLFQKKEGYGLLFQKNSKMAKILSPILNYYSTSSKYYNLMRKTFGKDVSTILYK